MPRTDVAGCAEVLVGWGLDESNLHEGTQAWPGPQGTMWTRRHGLSANVVATGLQAGDQKGVGLPTWPEVKARRPSPSPALSFVCLIG